MPAPAFGPGVALPAPMQLTFRLRWWQVGGFGLVFALAAWELWPTTTHVHCEKRSPSDGLFAECQVDGRGQKRVVRDVTGLETEAVWISDFHRVQLMARTREGLVRLGPAHGRESEWRSLLARGESCREDTSCTTADLTLRSPEGDGWALGAIGILFLLVSLSGVRVEYEPRRRQIILTELLGPMGLRRRRADATTWTGISTQQDRHSIWPVLVFTDGTRYPISVAGARALRRLRAFHERVVAELEGPSVRKNAQPRSRLK
jgi:hypothetical protein